MTVEDCRFCEIQEEPNAFDALQPAGDNVYFKPTLGMLVPGYLLSITNEHLTSFAQLGADRLAEVDEVLEEAEAQLPDKFGPYFRMEHGSDNITVCGSGGCVDHAHQHHVPDQRAAAELYKALEGKWQPLGRFEDLADFQGVLYIYLGHAGLHNVVAHPELPGQYGRRFIAASQGKPDEYDWALYSGARELFTTYCQMGGFPDGRFVFNLDDGHVSYTQKRRGGPPRLPDFDTTAWETMEALPRLLGAIALEESGEAAAGPTVL